jgi:hypothetical protein
MKYLWAIRLFLLIVWREWEPKSCGIPDPYRATGRISRTDAWEIASLIWLKK